MCATNLTRPCMNIYVQVHHMKNSMLKEEDADVYIRQDT